jgi:hypothetical protein
MLARTTAIAVTLAVALPALGAQKFTVSSQQAAPHAALGEAGTQGAGAVKLSAIGKAAGDWIDPTLAETGLMSGELVDGTGALRFGIHAVLSETAIPGFNPRKRSGSLTGFLAAPGLEASEVENPQLLVTGSWGIDTYTNDGDFEASIFMQGPTPMAPILFLGEMDGRLRHPEAHVKNESGSGLQATGSAVQRSFVARWDMPSM